MAEKSTYIKVDRNIVHWRWFQDRKVLQVWLWILVNANIQEREWLGRTVLRGQVITSVSTIKQQTDLSIQEVRTALSKLKSTGEITIESTSKYSVISIQNYDKYQGMATRHKTNEQQTNNKPLVDGATTTKEYIITKEKERKEGRYAEPPLWAAAGFASEAAYLKHVAELRR